MKVHILVFVVLVLGQTVAAQSTVHNVPCVSSQSVGLPTEAMMSAVPQWVKDRQQYETSYVYVPSAVSQPAEAMAAVVPQWVKDRQQYETSWLKDRKCTK